MATVASFIAIMVPATTTSMASEQNHIRIFNRSSPHLEKMLKASSKEMRMFHMIAHQDGENVAKDIAGRFGYPIEEEPVSATSRKSLQAQFSHRPTFERDLRKVSRKIRPKNHGNPVVICSVLAVTASCDKIEQKPTAKKSLGEIFGSAQNADPIRYQVIAADKAILKLDAATGQTWQLKDSHWESIATGPIPCTPTPQDPCTNVWLYSDQAQIREAPPIGTVDGGYRFKGGNPNGIEKWESRRSVN